MNLRAWRFVTLLLASMGSSFGAAHLLELPPRLRYDPALYTAVTSTLYRWFGIVGGIVQLGAILSAALLAVLVRGRPSFRWTVAGALCLILSLALWATVVQPVNAAWGEALQRGPEVAQAAYMRLRLRWEYGHVAAFVAWLAGFCLLIRSVLVETPRGGRLERAALPAIALLCVLGGSACRGEPGAEHRGEVPASPDTMVMAVGAELANRPIAPLRIDGACPFECCTYGDWTTTGETTLYEEPDSASARWTVPAGTRLEATSGFVVLTQLGVAVARDSVPLYTNEGVVRTAAPGDTLVVLDYVGEGSRRVWHQGTVFQTDAVSGVAAEGSPSPAELLTESRQEWWARARTPDGRTGWLWMDETPRMDGADACS